MRIALIDPSLFTYPYDQALAMGLVNGGHDVTLYSRRPGSEDGVPDNVKLDPIFYRFSQRPAVASLPSRMRLGLKGIDHAASMVRLLARLRRERPAVIHFQWLALPPVDRLLLGAFRRIAPLVLTVHDTEPFNGSPASKLQVVGFRQCLDQFDRLIVHTAQGEARLQRLGLPPERIVQHAMGPLYALAPDVMDPMTGQMTFMLFGKIKPYKGADILIEAFAAMPDALRGQARVRIVGKPYIDLAPLRAAIQARGLDVEIDPRFVDDADIADLFKPGVVAVFPYREIEASAVMHQAMACRRPIIASRLGSFAEMLRDGVHGHLTPVGDVAALSAAMSHMVEDRAFAAGCGAATRTLAAATPSWDEIARQTSRTYQDASAGSDGKTTAALPDHQQFGKAGGLAASSHLSKDSENNSMVTVADL